MNYAATLLSLLTLNTSAFAGDHNYLCSSREVSLKTSALPASKVDLGTDAQVVVVINGVEATYVGYSAQIDSPLFSKTVFKLREQAPGEVFGSGDLVELVVTKTEATSRGGPCGRGGCEPVVTARYVGQLKLNGNSYVSHCEKL